MFEQLVNDKRAFERFLCEAYSAAPNEVGVKEMVKKYRSFYKEALDIEEHVSQPDWSQFFDDNLDVLIGTIAEYKKSGGSGKKSKVIDPSVPSFSLGLSQDSDKGDDYVLNLGDGDKVADRDGTVNDGEKVSDGDVNNGEKVRDGAVNEGEKVRDGAVNEGEKVRDVPVNEGKKVRDGAVITRNTPVAASLGTKGGWTKKKILTLTLRDELRAMNKIQPVYINKPMNAQEQLVWRYLLSIVHDKSEAEKRKSDEGQNAKDESEKIIETENEEVERSFMKDIFATGYGVETRAFLLGNLVPGKELYASVINCWAAILNYQEKFRSPSSTRRLFCYASTFVEWMIKRQEKALKRLEAFKKHLLQVVEGFEDKMDLKSYDIIMVPMLEKHHFYLICFDLGDNSICVIDNMHPSTGMISMKDDTRYMSKGTPCKVKQIVCAYLKSVGHPKAGIIEQARPARLKIDWATTRNYTDCGVFLMRHMEMFMGKRARFDCGFSRDEDVKNIQLKNLRMIYAARIMLSGANIYRDKVISDAMKTDLSLKGSSIMERMLKDVSEHEETLARMDEEKDTETDTDIKHDGK